MSGMMGIERPSVREVLAQIVVGDGIGASARANAAASPDAHVPLPDAETRARDALTKFASSQTPWYLRVVIGIGAWFGSLFLLSFIVGSALFALGKELAPVFGGVLLVAAILLRRSSTGQLTRQIALVVGFTGQALLIGGVGDLAHSLVAASVAALIVSAVVIATFPDRVQRFASTLVIVGALVSLVHEWKVPHGMDALALGLLLSALMLWRVAPRAAMENAADIVEPVVFGLVISLFSLLLADMIFTIVDIREMLHLGAPTVAGFALMLLWLAASVLLEQGVPLQQPEAMLALAGIAALGALTRTTPAIMATLAIIVLGFDRRSRALVALATLFFLVFGSLYYYNLQLTLMQKSGVLAASGGVCLLASAFLRARFARFAAERP
jgi:hypothetical protein